MKGVLNILRLEFAPRSVDFALLVLRVWLGLSMLLLHGRGKLMGFSKLADSFPDPLGVGSTTSLLMAIAGEVVGSVLLVLGLLTRLGALLGMAAMSVAFFIVHQAALKGEHNGEMAFIYLAGYVTIFLAGGGRFAVDVKLGGRTR